MGQLVRDDNLLAARAAPAKAVVSVVLPEAVWKDLTFPTLGTGSQKARTDTFSKETALGLTGIENLKGGREGTFLSSAAGPGGGWALLGVMGTEGPERDHLVPGHHAAARGRACSGRASPQGSPCSLGRARKPPCGSQ